MLGDLAIDIGPMRISIGEGAYKIPRVEVRIALEDVGAAGALTTQALEKPNRESAFG